jgi:hypothetical protein
VRSSAYIFWTGSNDDSLARDGRSGGAVALVVTKDDTWCNPADGGCGAQEMNWRKRLEAGYASRAQAEAAVPGATIGPAHKGRSVNQARKPR